MRQLKSTLCLGLLILLFWGSPVAPLLAGSEPGQGQANWDRVKQLSPGQVIQVVQNNAQAFQGSLQSVSDDSIVIRLEAGERTFGKDNILRVSAKGRSHRMRNLGLGAGIGFAGGAGIGAASSNPSLCGRGCSAALGAVIGLAAGTAVGAALPTGGWHEVYRAR